MFKKKKLVRVAVTLVALVLTLAMTISITFAWIAMSTTPQIKGMQMDVTAGTPNLMLSIEQDSDPAVWQTNPSAFKSVFKSEEISKLLNDLTKAANDGGENYVTMPLCASTTLDGVEFTNIHGKESDQNLLGETFVANKQSKESLGGYYSFFLNFRSSAPYFVNLFSQSQIVIPKDINSKVKPVYVWKEEGIFQNEYGVHPAIPFDAPIFASFGYAIRFSFVDGDNVNIWNPTNSGSIQDLRLNANEGNPLENYYVFKNTGDPLRNFALDYFNAVQKTTYELQPEVSDNLMFDGSDNFLLQLQQSEQEGFEHFYFGRLRINIWGEGWDPNCTNSIMNDTLVIKLMFEGLSEPQI